MRISREFRRLEKKWVGARVKYFLHDIMDKASHGAKLLGPFTGVVRGLGDNGADIEQRNENLDHRHSVRHNGIMIIAPDNAPPHVEEHAYIENCEILP